MEAFLECYLNSVLKPEVGQVEGLRALFLLPVYLQTLGKARCRMVQASGFRPLLEASFLWLQSMWF